MSFVRSLMLAVLAVAGLAVAPAMASASEVSVIHAGILLATPGEQPKAKQSIIVRDGKVAEIRNGFVPASEVGADAVYDLSDRFVMPGFIDLHVHMTSARDFGKGDAFVKEPDEYFSLIGAHNAKIDLMAGFTTMRDLGSHGYTVLALRDAIRDGIVPGPKLIVSGAPISPSGGHADIHGYRPEIMAALPGQGVCDGADDCRRAVREAVRRGADVIKVMATGGVLDESDAGTGQQFTDEELKAIAETAHALGRKVTAHAHAKEGIDACLRAGFDSIEHAMWADEETMRLFKKTGAWLIPTIYPITYVGDTKEKLMKGPFKDLPPVMMEKLIKLGSQPKDMGRMAYKMGVKIALGTDTGVSPHGEDANEFIEYVNIGMSPMESLMAGTVNAAEAGGIKGVGRLTPGMAADVVALGSSPLDDIKSVLDVRFVMRDGIVFKSEK